MPTFHVGRAGSNPTGGTTRDPGAREEPGLASLAESVDAVPSKGTVHQGVRVQVPREARAFSGVLKMENRRPLVSGHPQ